MGVRIDFRIDAESDGGDFAFLPGQLVDDSQLGERLDVEAEDVVIQTEVDFPIRLANTCKNYLAGRETGIQRCLNLTAAYAVGSEAVAGDKLQHAGIGVGLDSVMDIIAIFASFVLDDIQCILEEG